MDEETSQLQTVKAYLHAKMVYGVAWSPFVTTRLAAGCVDTVVRIFDLTSSLDTAIMTFQDHSARVYNVSWNPLLENILASTGDDSNVQIWNTTTQ